MPVIKLATANRRKASNASPAASGVYKYIKG